ncbi:MAG: PdxA family protein [Bdellovibrionales bacterium]
MQKPNNRHLRISITTGDPDGIGSEVAAKALHRLGPQEDVQFLFWRSPQCPRSHLHLLEKKFSRISIKDHADVWTLPYDHREIIDVISPAAPAAWVWSSAHACMAGLCDALVTGPLSKTGQKAAGFTQLGHTEMLAKISGRKNLFMGFVGEHFGVVLTTAHVPLAAVKKHLTAKRLSLAIEHALQLRQLLPKAKRTLPIAVVGLNPHAGEQGLIGREEHSLMQPLLKRFRQRGHLLLGPLVPDAAFLPHMQEQISIYVCPYHDQGLIPFKMVHGFDQGIHLTMGLPFVRTSVDHGTAKELFTKNQASEGSMLEALTSAIYLCQTERGLL